MIYDNTFQWRTRAVIPVHPNDPPVWVAFGTDTPRRVAAWIEAEDTSGRRGWLPAVTRDDDAVTGTAPGGYRHYEGEFVLLTTRAAATAHRDSVLAALAESDRKALADAWDKLHELDNRAMAKAART